eukprot:263850_1
MWLFTNMSAQLNDAKTRYENTSRWKKVIAGIVVVTAVYKLYSYNKRNAKVKDVCYYPNVPHFKAKKILDCKTQLGECCLWDDRKKLLCWIDNVGKKFWTYDPITKESKSYDCPECPGSFAFCEDGSYLFAFETGPSFYNIKTQKQSKKIFNFEPNKNTKMNDGRCDRNGRFVVGGMVKFYGTKDDNIFMKWINYFRNIILFSGKTTSSIYRINEDLSVQLLVENIKCTNSICFNLDGNLMFYTDTIGWLNDSKIMKMKYYNDKQIPSNTQIFTKNCKYPDGSVIDSDGNIWSAHCGVGVVSCINKNGKVVLVVDIDDKYPTCCTFGGENLDILFITTLHPGNMQIVEKGWGALYAIKIPNVNGCIENRFVGTVDKL